MIAEQTGVVYEGFSFKACADGKLKSLVLPLCFENTECLRHCRGHLFVMCNTLFEEASLRTYLFAVVAKSATQQLASKNSVHAKFKGIVDYDVAGSLQHELAKWRIYMSFPKLVARYIAPFENRKGLSYPQLLALHVAATYMLRQFHCGTWLADVPCPPMRHAPSTIKSLVKPGWLEGNSYAVNVAMGDEDLAGEKATLWISAKGKTLIEEIAVESGWVFDEANYDLVRNRTEYRFIQAKGAEEKEVEKDIIELGTFDHEWEAIGACDQAAILLCGDDAQTYSPRWAHEDRFLSNEVIRQISALKEVDRPTVLAKLKKAGLLDFL
jgi:hypothetical protein